MRNTIGAGRRMSLTTPDIAVEVEPRGLVLRQFNHALKRPSGFLQHLRLQVDLVARGFTLVLQHAQHILQLDARHKLAVSAGAEVKQDLFARRQFGPDKLGQPTRGEQRKLLRWGLAHVLNHPLGAQDLVIIDEAQHIRSTLRMGQHCDTRVGSLQLVDQIRTAFSLV